MTTLDGVRIETAKIQAQRALDIAAQGTLSEYDYDLSKEYGLMGYNTGGSEARFQFFLEANLPSEDNELFSHLYNINVAEGSLKTDAVAFDEGEVKYQVLEYMKYRAPLMTLSPFLHKIQTVIKSAKTTQRMSEKVKNVDAKMKDLTDQYEILRKAVDGWWLEGGKAVKVGEEEKYVNKWDEAISIYDKELKTIEKLFDAYTEDLDDFEGAYLYHALYIEGYEPAYEAFKELISDIALLKSDYFTQNELKPRELELEQVEYEKMFFVYNGLRGFFC